VLQARVSCTCSHRFIKLRRISWDVIRRWTSTIGLALLVVIGSSLITFSQPLADWWGRQSIGRLMAPLGGFDVHVVMWFGVGVTVLQLAPDRRRGERRFLGYAFLASLIFEIAQPIFTPRNFEIADLAANLVGLAIAEWWVVGRDSETENS
jgi:hypothetical protein